MTSSTNEPPTTGRAVPPTDAPPTGAEPTGAPPTGAQPGDGEPGFAGLSVRWVTPGADADAALDAVIAGARRDDPLARVTVVVPTKVAGLALRRARASRPGGTVGVQFEVLEQVAEHLATPGLAGAGSQPLTSEVHDLLVTEAVHRRPGALGDLADNTGTITALARAVARLRDATAGIDPEPLLAALADDHDRLRDTLVEVFREYGHLARGHHDVHDLLLAAGEAAPDRVRADVGHLVIHLPTDASVPAGQFVQAVARHLPVTVHLGRTGDAWADRVTADVGRRLAGSRPSPADDEPDATAAMPAFDVVVTPDPEEEVRQAARIISAAMHDGVDPARIQVLHASEDPYVSLLHEVFATADLPHNGTPTRRVGQTIAARVLTEAIAWHDEDHPRGRLLDLLGSTPILVDGRRPPTAAWDRVARRARVIGGRGHWDHRLAGHAATLGDQIASEETPDWLRSRLETERDQALELRDLALGLADRLTADGTATWQAWSAWALGILDHLLGRSRRAWPETDREAEGLLRQRLEALGQLDDLDVGDGATARTVTRKDLLRVLAADLDAPAARVGRAGVGVHVAPLERAGHLPVDRTIVLGAVEGTLPSRPHGGPFLPDGVVQDLRTRLDDPAATPDLDLADARVDRLRQATWRVLATSGHTTFTVARIDRRQERPARPSPWVLELLRTHLGRPVSVDEVLGGRLDDAPVTVVESAMAGLLATSTAAGPRERRRAALARAALSGQSLADHPLLAGLTGVRNGIEVLAARSSTTFTPWDGNVVGHRDLLARILARPRSPGRLATYGECPRRWLFDQALHIVTEEPPRQWLDVDALDRGILVHDTLEDFVAEAMPDHLPAAPAGSAAAAPASRATPGSLDRLRELFDEHSATLERTGRVGLLALWEQRRQRLWRQLEAWHRADQQLREQGWRPAAVEQAFGLADHDDVLQVETTSGHTLSFRGRMDRLDTAEAGVAVYDYKTAHPDRYRGLESDITLGGTDLQLAIYSLVADRAFPDRAVAVAYWHVHDRAAAKPPPLVPVDDRTRARIDEVLDTIGRGIVDGVFPADPGPESLWPTPDFEHCRYCPFTTICPSHGERQRAAQRDLASPEAAVLAPLAESAVLAEEEPA